MKSKERHELKRNEFATTTFRLLDVVETHRTQVLAGAGIVVLLAALIGGVMLWRSHKANQAGAALGVAMAIAEAPVVPASTLPGATQAPGTYPTEQARAEAAINAFTEVATSYPGTDAARVATYHAASELLAAGRAAEAEQAFAAVAADGAQPVLAASGKLGQAEALMSVGRIDDALKIYTDLAAMRDGVLPVDGLLMQLARASKLAGKEAEARAAFQRVLDEFPQSTYTMTAQQELAALN